MILYSHFTKNGIISKLVNRSDNLKLSTSLLRSIIRQSWYAGSQCYLTRMIEGIVVSINELIAGDK
jgi:hypothetical protein